MQQVLVPFACSESATASPVIAAGEAYSQIYCCAALYCRTVAITVCCRMQMLKTVDGNAQLYVTDTCSHELTRLYDAQFQLQRMRPSIAASQLVCCDMRLEPICCDTPPCFRIHTIPSPIAVINIAALTRIGHWAYYTLQSNDHYADRFSSHIVSLPPPPPPLLLLLLLRYDVMYFVMLQLN